VLQERRQRGCLATRPDANPRATFAPTVAPVIFECKLDGRAVLLVHAIAQLEGAPGECAESAFSLLGRRSALFGECRILGLQTAFARLLLILARRLRTRSKSTFVPGVPVMR
jgi:hypothetical protein